MGNQQSMTQGSAKQQHPEEAPTMQPEDYTTVMLRNLPNNYTREMLVELLESKGFRQRFDFLYVPVDFAKSAGLGYAFVNFVSSEDGSRAMRVLESFDDWKVPSQKVLRLSWSLPLQGLASNIERYRNSAVMHPDVPEHFKPMVFENGCMVSFPAPTRNIALGVRSKAGRTYVYGAAPPEQSRTREEHEKPKARKVHQRLAVSPENHEEDHSTVMLRNLPNDYSRDMLVELLECTGFKKRFDFLYLPIDFEKGSGLGYAFVNFVDHRDALDAMKTLASFDDWKVPSSKRLELSWSIPLQGLSANVERYRNNSVMHPNVPERYKPLVLKGGQPAPFPAPTRNIHPPHRRR
jgi:RNA recognition motif-containing protein